MRLFALPSLNAVHLLLVPQALVLVLVLPQVQPFCCYP
jgi:hypothetical protein